MKLEEAVNNVILVLYNVARKADGKDGETIMESVPLGKLCIIIWLCLPEKFQNDERNFEEIRKLVVKNHMDKYGKIKRKGCVRICRWQGQLIVDEGKDDKQLKFRTWYFVRYFVQDVLGNLTEEEQIYWGRVMTYFFYGSVLAQPVGLEKKKWLKRICGKIAKYGNPPVELNMGSDEKIAFQRKIEQTHKEYEEEWNAQNRDDNPPWLMLQKIKSTITMGYANWQ